MYHEMRMKNRELDKAAAEQILTQGEYGILSTVGKDSIPYGVPLSYAYVNGIIYFHCAADVGHKLENIAHQNKVCFTVVGKTEIIPEKFSTKYESVIAFGTAHPAEDKYLGLRLLQEKYSPSFEKAGLAYARKAIDAVSVYEITVENLTAKGSLRSGDCP